MPTVKADELRDLATRIFAAAGAPQRDAEWIATLLVRANLRGHDSHGVIHVPRYVARCRAGGLDPRAKPTVIRDNLATALVDGCNGFGHVVARYATEVAIAKAERVGLSAVGIINCNHIGRLADYAEMIMARGMIGIVHANASGDALLVAPHGGVGRLLSTNPFAIAFPSGKAAPMVFDMATSVVAAGKLLVKRNRKEDSPPGWLVDAQGNPTTATARFYEEPRGALLPVGGHKGYGLALMVEILGGILTGSGSSAESKGTPRNGTLIQAIRIEDFVPKEQYTAEVDALLTRMRAARPAPGVTRVMVPGDPEAFSEAERGANGIPIEDETWNQIQATARDLKVQ